VTPSAKAQALLQADRNGRADGRDEEEDFCAAEKASKSLLASILAKKHGQPSPAAGAGAGRTAGAAQPKQAPSSPRVVGGASGQKPPLSRSISSVKEDEFREKVHSVTRLLCSASGAQEQPYSMDAFWRLLHDLEGTSIHVINFYRSNGHTTMECSACQISNASEKQ
jgi:hypothetical protein